MKSYELYIKTDCSYCKKAVEFLSQKELPFVVTVVDKDPEYLERVKKLYTCTTVPIVLECEGEEKTLIGGFSDLEEHLTTDLIKV